MIDYSFLRDIYKKEMASSELSMLEPTFYKEVIKVINKKKSDGSYESIKEIEKMLKVLKNILIRRREKILLLSLLDQFDDSILTEEERNFLKLVKESYFKSFSDIHSLYSDNNGKSQSTEGLLKVSVKIIKQVDAYKGLDNNVYGPFSPGQVLDLPKPEAEWLINAKFAERV